MKYIAAVTLAALLTACGGGGSETLENGHKTIGQPDCAASAACV